MKLKKHLRFLMTDKTVKKECTLKIAYKKRNDKKNIKTSEVIVKTNN